MARKTIEERLVEAEQRLKQIKEQARKRKAREQAATKQRERKEDANRKIRLGGLVVLAQLTDADKGFLLGALLDAAQRQQDQQYAARCKAMGDALLNQQENENRSSAAAQAQG
ncbi:conjugal transfer protein TraD [Thauera chlorobenzoica]|uniref:conjugal transfer protein TraD n=1 Tax=Thauera chlorobenzoica TaxID=96773 RepID=UPI0008A01BE4|nr:MULTISPECIES: conjugal transfer protein TraD [Thauera]MCK2127259.1 conjugal transfer protein TraD [Thauera aromatica]SEF39316.1 Conjugal transfer protein TraD [Thauera chlorobenzoica]